MSVTRLGNRCGEYWAGPKQDFARLCASNKFVLRTLRRKHYLSLFVESFPTKTMSNICVPPLTIL